MRRTLDETIARAEFLMADDHIPREVVRDLRGDYWIVRREDSAIMDMLDEPAVVWSPKTVRG